MPDINLRFHALPEEILPLIHDALTDPEVHLFGIRFSPFSADELREDAVDEAVLHGPAERFVLATDVPSHFSREARARLEAVESGVRYEERSVYDLEGEFDFAFMGWVLQTLDDPIRALKAVRRVAGQLLVLDTVSMPLDLLPAPLARLDARRDGGEWFVFNRRGLRKALEIAGWRVVSATGILRERYLK